MHSEAEFHKNRIHREARRSGQSCAMQGSGGPVGSILNSAIYRTTVISRFGQRVALILYETNFALFSSN